ncbi:carbohydrate porin [Acetobacteraceae bacterium]|nr:carbohydrate porin [Acetobacteraceae bacterium]
MVCFVRSPRETAPVRTSCLFDKRWLYTLSFFIFGLWALIFEAKPVFAQELDLSEIAQDRPFSQVEDDKASLEASEGMEEQESPLKTKPTAQTEMRVSFTEAEREKHLAERALEQARQHRVTSKGLLLQQSQAHQYTYRNLSEVAGDRMTLQDSTPSVNNSGAVVAAQSMSSQKIPLPWERGTDITNNGDIMHRSKMLGSMFGARNLLDHFGITFGLLDIEEVWGNPSGGTPSQAQGSPAWGGNGRGGGGQGASYDAVTLLSMQVDLRKTLGPKMGLFNISGMQIRGRSISQDHLSVFNPISGQEADRSFRLFELWYQQPFFHNVMDVRIGEMDLDNEFLISAYGGLYLNADFGWPLIPSADLYSGGPSWPLASPGIRFRFRPSERFTFMFAASDDNPPGNQNSAFAIQNGGNTADPTNQNYGNSASGTRFNTNTGVLLMEELQYSVTFGKHHGGLPGVYKLGGYYDTADYPSFYKNAIGEPLGNPHDSADVNTPAWVRSNWAVYGIMDQMIWRSRSNPYQSVGVFFRGMGTQGDRNLVTFAADAGINLKAPFHNRPNDTLGLGWGIGVAGDGARHFDRETGTIQQTAEDHMELTYQAMVTPWLNIQPDFQYIFRPSGGVQDYAYNTLKRVGDEAILGVHADIRF